MAAEYPSAVFTEMIRGALMSDAVTQGDFVDKLQEELRAVQSTLGVNPQGGAATVKARLDRVPFMVRGGDTANVTDASGFSPYISFGTTFPGVPTVIAVSGDVVAQVHEVDHSNVSTTQFRVRVVLLNPGVGPATVAGAGSAFRTTWWAFYSTP